MVYLRKKGKYYQIAENIDGRERIRLHLGTIQKIEEVFRAHKEMLKQSKEVKDE